jgi:hypothetical protein
MKLVMDTTQLCLSPHSNCFHHHKIPFNFLTILFQYEIAAADRLSAQIPRLTDVTRSTRVHLTGLLPATSYTARVRAFTVRGAGPWSPDLRFQTRPSALRDMPQPRVYATGPREAQLVWQTSQGQANYWDKFACSFAPAGTPNYQVGLFRVPNVQYKYIMCFAGGARIPRL